MDPAPTRRGVVTLLGSLGLAGITATTAVAGRRTDAFTDRGPNAPAALADVRSPPNAATRETYTVLEGTEHATDVVVIEAAADGPTALVVGGIHGNEESGYLAADEIADLTIDAGTLVVLPRANVVAIERDTRVGDSGDLNRQFPTGEEPRTELARAIWDVVRRHEPDRLLDLHRSAGIYGVDEDATGQAVFYAPADRETARAAFDATTTVNEQVVPDSSPDYEFQAVPIDLGLDPSGLLVGKAAQDLGVSSYLVEVTSKGLDLDTRVRWTRAVANELLSGAVLLEDPPAHPVARIATTPPDAAERDLDEGATVELDAAGSSDPDGEIAAYEWDVDGDGTLDAGGATAEATLDFCGELTVRLRVTGDDGLTDTASVTLSTVA